jgi:hypothetical protein
VTRRETRAWLRAGGWSYDRKGANGWRHPDALCGLVLPRGGVGVPQEYLGRLANMARRPTDKAVLP